VDENTVVTGRDTIFHTVRYSALLTSQHRITVGHLFFGGWEVIVEGPNPTRFDFSFHSDDDAKKRGYQMTIDHLVAQGVSDAKAFDELDWQQEGVPES
jgi:hypothetical protein